MADVRFENPLKIFRPPARALPATLALALILMTAPAAWSAPALAAEPGEAPLWPHEKSDLAPDPALVFGRFDNGFRYALMRNEKPEGRVSMHLNIQSGSFHETEDQRGLAHFLEHMLFNGSEHFAPGELVRYFQRIGMQFGPDANAHTGFFETVYDVVLPESGQKQMDEGLLVLRDYAAGALLLPAEIDRERKVILAEKRSRDSVSYRTFEETIEFELPGSRIARRLPIGETAVLETAGRKQLADYYDAWYRPERMILVMVGQFDPETAAKLIRKHFADLAARAPARPEPDLEKIDHNGVKTFYHYEKEAGNTRVSMETVGIEPRQPDSLELESALLMEEMASQIVQNRLDAMLKSPDTPFTTASAGSGVYLNQVRYAEISADGPPENWDASLGAIERVLRRALDHGFTRAETERVKKDYLAGLDRAVGAADTRDSSDLARQIISNLNRDRVFQSPAQERDTYAPVISGATAESLHAAFRRVWSPDHRLVLVTGNASIAEGQAAPAKERIMGAFEAGRKTPVQPPEETAAVAFPYGKPEAEPGEILGRAHVEDLDIHQIDFKNGLRLNFKRTPFEANTVKAVLSFGPGRYGEPPNKPGLAPLAEAVVSESGLGAMERDALDRALAGRNTDVVFGISDASIFFKGETVTRELELLFQLLRAHITDPAFRERAYDLSMARFEQKYLALSRSVDGALMLEGQRFLAGGDTRFGLPSMEQFRTLTLADARNWLAPRMENQPLELSVAGDADAETVIELAARYLGSLPPRAADTASLPARGDRHPVFPAGHALALDVDTRIPKGLTVVAYPTDDIWNIGRTRRLSVMASVFSDRLRETIREKLGATYSPVAYNDPSRAYPGYGVFQAMIHVDPAAADAVIASVRQIAADIRKEGVSEDELRRAVDPTLTGIADMRQQNSYWLSTVMDGSRAHPEQIEWARTIVNDYRAITAGEVEKLARIYLDNNLSAILTIRPASSPAPSDQAETNPKTTPQAQKEN